MSHLCRAVEKLDGSVEIIHPAYGDSARPPDESDDDFAQRAFVETIAKLPHLQGRPFQDLQSDELPPREEDCPGCGETHSVRNHWRLEAGKVKKAPGLRNIHAEIRHYQIDLEDEAAKLIADGAACALIQARIALLAKYTHPDEPNLPPLPPAPPSRNRKRV